MNAFDYHKPIGDSSSPGGGIQGFGTTNHGNEYRVGSGDGIGSTVLWGIPEDGQQQPFSYPPADSYDNTALGSINIPY
jgi:hypothetical protein